MKVGTPQQVKVGPNQAIHVVNHVQGPADPVTGKKPTLMVDRYLLGNKGRVIYGLQPGFHRAQRNRLVAGRSSPRPVFLPLGTPGPPPPRAPASG